MSAPPSPTPLSSAVHYALSWLLLLGGLAFGLHRSWHYFDDPDRADGNGGHVTSASRYALDFSFVDRGRQAQRQIASELLCLQRAHGG